MRLREDTDGPRVRLRLQRWQARPQGGTRQPNVRAEEVIRIHPEPGSAKPRLPVLSWHQMQRHTAVQGDKSESTEG